MKNHDLVWSHLRQESIYFRCKAASGLPSTGHKDVGWWASGGRTASAASDDAVTGVAQRAVSRHKRHICDGISYGWPQHRKYTATPRDSMLLPGMSSVSVAVLMVDGRQSLRDRQPTCPRNRGVSADSAAREVYLLCIAAEIVPSYCSRRLSTCLCCPDKSKRSYQVVQPRVGPAACCAAAALVRATRARATRA